MTVSHSSGIHSLSGSSPLVQQVTLTEPTLWSPDQVPPELADTPTYYQRLIGPTPPTAFQFSEIMHTLQEESELLGCTDGSYVEAEDQCYQGWIVASDASRTIAEGSGAGHGHPNVLSSYRAELSGILALLYLVYRISSYHGITAGAIRVYCDNKSALSKTVKVAPLGITPFLTTDYDLIHLIRIYVSLLPITLYGEWVKGHYSGERREYKHDLNDRADSLATSAHRRLPGQYATQPVVPAPPGYRVRLFNRKGLIASKYYQFLAQAHHEQPLIEHILRKTGWSKEVFNSIDWDAHHRAIRRLSRFQRIGIAKLVHHLSNTNRQNHLLYGTSDQCPGCGTYEETFEHVLRCSFAITTQVRSVALERPYDSLVAIGTPPKLCGIIKEGFRDWLDPTFPSNRRSRPSTFGSLRPENILLTQAYTAQYHSIGWHQFCLGRISKKWHDAMKALLPPTQPYCRLQWGSHLINALWQFTKSIWHHQNALVHGADAAASAQSILNGLRDRVRAHYHAYQECSGYVLARHQYLFMSRTLDQRLSVSYDYLNCWLRSVDEAWLALEIHISSQQSAARQFFGLATSTLHHTSDDSDSDCDASHDQDTASTLVITHSTQPTTISDELDSYSFSDTSSIGVMINRSLVDEDCHFELDDSDRLPQYPWEDTPQDSSSSTDSNGFARPMFSPSSSDTDDNSLLRPLG
jgi:hypothetical protein